MKRATPEEVTYPPGWFLEPVYAWFGPDWKSSIKHGNAANAGSAASQRAMQTRERLMAEGVASAAGTMNMPNSPKGLGPKPMTLTLKRPLAGEPPVYAFKDGSTAKAVYGMLQLGPLPLQTLAERLNMPALNLRSRIKRAIDLKVFLTERTGNSAMVRLGPTKPLNEEQQ